MFSIWIYFNIWIYSKDPCQLKRLPKQPFLTAHRKWFAISVLRFWYMYLRLERREIYERGFLQNWCFVSVSSHFFQKYYRYCAECGSLNLSYTPYCNTASGVYLVLSWLSDVNPVRWNIFVYNLYLWTNLMIWHRKYKYDISVSFLKSILSDPHKQLGRVKRKVPPHYENTPIQIYWKFHHKKEMKIFK